ncbi:hypothetical protein Lal_00038581 [Lupinus albus]|nr:hypothetical protein Lal_00038581 [Lupinus albus]
MPPKNSQKELDEPLTQILIDKLKENQEQQDARHAAITTVMHTITERLADIREELMWEMKFCMKKKEVTMGKRTEKAP